MNRSRNAASRPRRIRITVVDAAAILAACAAVFLSSQHAAAAAGEPQAVITAGDGREWIYPLPGERKVRISGPLGTTVVQIREDDVLIDSSPCPNQTCVAIGKIGQPGQWVVCLPNQVMVRIEGGPDDGSEVDIGAW
ncbi:MAG TPA: NusG domain II-containing protein [Magnetospirillaceae bacterium]|nr:NusG domain II-containing protein [Magnetospirillaceae bacterium]